MFAIAAEPRVAEIIRSLDIRRHEETAPLFVRRAGTADTHFIGARGDGSCVFLESDNGHLCAIHSRAGVDALPSSCRHFPRVFLHDARGIFVSLSHFCPTAAALLLEDCPLAIVEAESPLVLDGTIEAFDAVDALPPLLQPNLLMDLEAYDAWERAAVATFAREDLTPDEAVALIGSATEALRTWKVGGRPLVSCVAESFRDAGARPLPIDDHGRDPIRLALLGAPASVNPAPVNEESWEKLVTPVWGRFDPAVKRYLAGKLYGNRIAYEAKGLRSIVEWLRMALALVRSEATRACEEAGSVLDRQMFIEAVRAADLLLVHRLDARELARTLALTESKNSELRT